MRFLAMSSACGSVAVAVTLVVLAAQVPAEPPAMPHGDTAAWFTAIERDYVPSFPPLGRMFGSYDIDRLEFCHEPMVDPGPETFRYSSHGSRAASCDEAARSLRTRYFRCAALLVGLWLFAAAMFARFAARPSRGPLVTLAASALFASPVATEQLLRADYWPDMFMLFSPALASALLLGILLVMERWPKAAPGEPSGQRPLGWRAVIASLVFVGGLGTVVGGAHERDATLIKLGVAFCLAAFSMGARIFLKLRKRGSAPANAPEPRADH